MNPNFFYPGMRRPTPRKFSALQRLHPEGLDPDWADKLHDQLFVSEHTQSTHEHYLQVWDPSTLQYILFFNQYCFLKGREGGAG